MSAQDPADLVLKIGEYQLRNLRANRVGFHFFDLRSEPVSPISNDATALLQGSEALPPDQVLSTLRARSVADDAPIVLICEDGKKSMATALILAQNSYINVFVVEGGTQALK